MVILRLYYSHESRKYSHFEGEAESLPETCTIRTGDCGDIAQTGGSKNPTP